ncbi:MAG: redox-regulated ATPase YchF [Patescibacteria group bacterium]
MSKLSIGIVGLPNVGKSTLFNALLKKQVALAANYPFATIEPNVGVVEVPDERLAKLAEVVHSNTLVPAIVEFYDIAGLVKGASTGEGLGNQFLSHIREVSAIAYVHRLFEDGDVIHVHETVDPMRDLEIIQSELILADLQTVGKQNDRKAPVLPPSLSHIKLDNKKWQELILSLKNHLNSGKPARDMNMSEEETLIFRQLNLLTSKPVIHIFNISEKQLSDYGSDKDAFFAKYNLGEVAKNALYLNAKLESDLAGFSPDEAQALLESYSLDEPGLNKLIKTAYDTLGLQSFLTAGEKEVRAWTITKGMKAPQAAGVIHTDFEKHFIKADIVPYNSFIELGGWTKCRDAGKVVSAGKEYIMQEGDVVEFKVGI